MSEMLQSGEPATDNRLLLAYLRHTAQTAQPAAARRLFALFAQQEKRWIQARGGFQAPASGHGIGQFRTPLDLASAEISWQATYS